MSERRPAVCARCGLTAPRRGVTWPEGYVCRRCYQQATRRRGSCAGCQQERLLPGLDQQQQPICTDCAGITQDLTCTRCGEQDEPHRRGLCARCCLREDLTRLLGDGTGNAAPHMAALLEALTGQPHPRSAIIWLRNPDVIRMLAGLARGELAMSHDTFDAEPEQRTAMHLRELLIRCGTLPPRDRILTAFTAWLDRTLHGHSPLPAGHTWDGLEQRWTSQAAAGVWQLGQVGIIEEAAGLESQCQWEGAWLNAHQAHDSAAAQTAAQVLADIPHWHVTTAYDATGGVARLAEQVAAAAAAGNPDLPQQAFDVNCTNAKPGT